MTMRTRHVLECDQCGGEQTGPDRRRLRKLAKNIGWDLGHGRNADMCPWCVGQGETKESE